jgi:predicted transcriptional regulator YdeE
MKKQKLNSKKVIGIWIRTTNQEQQAMSDIQVLWGRFIAEQIPSKIPNKVNDTVYSIYTEYEGDYTKPYTTILACEVSSLEEIPEGMKGLEIAGGDYLVVP